MKHVTDQDLYRVLNNGYPSYDSPRDEVEAHIETCDKCQKRFGELKKFYEDTKEVIV